MCCRDAARTAKGRNMSMYIIQDKETGTGIDIFDTLEEAERVLKEYENDDMKEGVYTPNFYEIVEVKICAEVKEE